MKCHQILTGACNVGDRCFAVGSVEGIPFTAYAAGCNIVILANTFERVQVIPGVCHDNVQISCVDCSTDTGKIAAAYGKLVCIFEPTPLVNQNSGHRLDYCWIQTGMIEAQCYINTLSWNLEGTRLLTAGDALQLWASPALKMGGDEPGPVHFDLGDEKEEDELSWSCIWTCVTATPTVFLSFSPDGTLFATASSCDRLVKIWYDNKHVVHPVRPHEGTSLASDLTRTAISFGYIYLPHPGAVTGFSWRTTSKYMPKGSVSNMLVTSCRDNICRVWVETVLPDDGLVSLNHLDPVAAQNPRFRTHRHKHRFMQRLKHIKACFHIRRQVKGGGGYYVGGVGMPSCLGGIEPLPTLPSSYSVHDFHQYGVHASGMTPGFHFHLAASINAETDIPLVPSISGTTGAGDTEQNFVLHWLNNKEMHFSTEAENILLEISRRAMEKETVSGDHDHQSEVSDLDDPRIRAAGVIRLGSRTPSRMTVRTRSVDEDDPQSQQSASIRSHQALSAATSSTSIATDVTTATTAALGDALDRRIETLLRDWHQTSDVLFSIHPVDGSLLVWIIDFLDNYPGSFRQAQVSFSARIPNALPLGDAMTMSPNLAIYNGSTPSFLKQLLKLELAMEEESRSAKSKSKSNLTLASTDESDGCGSNGSPSPIISMTTKHSNGSLNLWHLTVAEGSKFTQVLNISHFTRVCGHRFQLNDIKCHPVLPLLLSTSHHNKKESSPSNPPHSSTADDTPLICIQDTTYKDWCSELILWRVDAVGPLSKSGGVTELARINSPQVSAFSNVAWIPTLLPSTTLGSVSNSPSACFVASDGENLRVYQAVIDGRALLAEISTAERKKRMMESTLSLSSDSSIQEQIGQQSLADIFNIVSEQSTARPGCVIQLDIIKDASNDWQNTQFLHVLQEGLIRGERAATTSEETGPFNPQHAPMVDLHTSAVFEEPFYITLLEKTPTGSVIHMWRLVIASQHHTHEGHEGEEYGSGRSTPVAGAQAQRVDASPVVIKTAKICAVPLPLPVGVEVIHAAPTAGHLSSASIYPACFSPYVLVTACSDKVVRFWRCRMTGDGDELKVQWLEWNMVSKDSNSSIKVPGQPLHVSAAYSGRMACAYQTPGQESTVVTSSNGTITFACSIAIYECESTGGSQWILEDKFDLRDVLSTPAEIGHDLDLTYLSQLTQGKSLSRLTSALSSEDVSQGHTPTPYSQDHPSADALHSVSSQLLVPSPSTLQCLRSNKFDKRGVSVKQKHPIQIDWVSKEDGSHILTVTIGSKVLLYTAVADDVAVLAGKDGKSEGDGRSRPMLQKTLSMPRIADASNLPRWMGLERFSLVTADGLAPLPMQMSWVRDGILVVGMDNEMHVYSQWRQEARGKGLSEEPVSESLVYERDLTEAYLKNYLQEASHNLKTATSMSRVTSYSVLSALETKRKKGLSDVMTSGMDECALLWPTLGLFEASHMASPVLPQYHPRQLIELLNSGKIKRVKAILAHLLRCLSSIGQRNNESLLRGSISDADDARTRSWSRSRTLSVSGGGQAGSVSREGRGSVSLRPEELTLDYVEITAIPPLPLWLLLEADKDTQCQHTVAKAEKKEDTYAELFGAPSMTVEDDLTLDEDEGDIGPRRISLTHESKGIAYFGPRQAQILSTLLTHTHLPGLSSLDQMHLLALGDTVASCNVDFADRFDINKAKEAIAKEAYSRSMTDEPSMEALDDCGIRFLLAMRHHTYLLRCLPIGQRATLQKAGIGSHNIVWAFHSESQEELLDFIPSVRQSNPRWSELRELGIGWWVRNNSVLAKCMQKVAKAAFQVKNDPLDAAIYYLAMKKKSLVWGLFRSINDRRMTDFFSNNFAEERWRKAALKNAFALLGKQRFEQAAGFFLLAGALKDAIEVVLNKLEDLQLAMVITRLYEGELEATPPSLCKLLHEVILGCDGNGDNYDPAKAHPDPFLRSIAHWILRDYGNSLNTLLQTDPSIGIEHKKYTEAKKNSSNVISADPSVFNFYIYLRTHPLLIRQCIANTAKDSGGSLMASRFGPGQDSLDKKSVYESSMTPLERRLYFTTSHAHLRSGCPTLALEVLSKLPDNVIDPDNPEDGDLLGSPVKEKKPAQQMIHSGTLDAADSFDWSKPSAAKDAASSLFGPPSTDSAGLDWSTPMSFQSKKDDDDLDLDFSIGNEDDEDLDLEIEEDKQKPKELPKEQNAEGVVDNSSKRLDIMAQQLKFVSCLKMMMEELATLATGCEVDGGQLRYQLYVWLEREVEALKEVCNYRSTLAVTGEDLVETGIGEETEKPRTPSPIPTSEPSTLHEILQQEKLEFEAKMERAAKRKRWLTANQQLLRTLLSYCSLHGSSGGGLASVRMELVLLLQELQQESSKQQLLSPLPFPTTLPLLSASIASNKTVVSDPIRHLQAGTHDLLQSLVEIKGIARPSNHMMAGAVVLRNLAAALSACIYQSLCDSETFTVKAHHRVAALGVDIQHVTEAHRESHLVARESRSHIMQDEEPLQVCTPPAKWPGVTSLLALIARERDEDTPKLTILLCEAYIAVYLSLLVHGIATCDAYVLYRLVAQPVGEKEWATLFGGGVKKLLKVITNVLQTQTSVEKDTVAQGNSERLLSTFSNLQKTRIKFNMKLLGQLGFQDPRASTSDGDSKPAYREQFLPPDMSIVSHLMKKPPLPSGYENIDYDSSTSDEEELEDEYEEDDDIFKEPKNLSENNEHCDPDSYSWCLLRMSCIRMAQVIVNKFLEVAGVELQELPMQSPLLHSILRVLDSWLASVVAHLEGKKGPPPEYIPGCFADTMASGPAILKYRGILEKHNTPFVRGKRGVKPVERLWNYLVRQEHVQHVFVRYIFGRKRPIPEPVQHVEEEEDISDSGDGGDGLGTEVASEAGGGESHHDTIEHVASESNQMSLEPVKVIHKDQDSITAFCINKINPGSIALATVKEVQELDMTLLLEHPAWLINECELDVLALNTDPESVPPSNYMVVQTPMDKGLLEGKGPDASLSTSSSINLSGISGGTHSIMSQSGRGTNVLKELKGVNFPGSNNPRFCRFIVERSRHYLKPVLSHRIEGVRRMTSHPVLPLYLLGCQDGSVVVREWHHSSVVARPRPGGTFAKVARLHFNQQGNKFGVMDGDGNLSLFQLGLASQTNKPFYSHQCHTKHGSDFVFVGSSSLIATAGQSSEHRNIAMWDTLMPQRKANIVSWNCHENGASALIYAPQHQVLISAGKKGTVCIFDIRQRSLRHKFQAHDGAIKCTVLDPSEEFFCTGSADGDIKVWGLSIHSLVYNLPGEHSRSSLFKNLSQGVTQLHLDTSNRLFSCGADGSIKLRQLPERDLNINML